MSLEHWRLSARAQAFELFQKGLKAANPKKAVLDALENSDFDTKNLQFIALGKAATPMMEAALSWYCHYQPIESLKALSVTNPENFRTIDYVTSLMGDHPTPSERGVHSALKVEAFLRKASQKSHIILLLSGGASALLPAPIEGVTLKDKIILNNQLLSKGLPIEEINIIRRALSRLKGGGFLKQAHPAKVSVFVLSDVVSDDFKFIASGPCIARDASENPRSILEKYHLWDGLSPSLQTILQRPIEENPLKSEHILIGSNRQSVRAMNEGIKAELEPLPFEGDVIEVAHKIAFKMKQGKGIYLSGGEPTVTLKGAGKGGRNQELALRVALNLSEYNHPWVFLAAGSDGRDGATDAAGACVDFESIKRMKAHSIDIIKELEANNSYYALKASDDLMITGGTATNVADLHVTILKNPKFLG